MSEVSPTQLHDGMGALHAGNTVESLRPLRGIEINKDGPLSLFFEDISQNPQINEQLTDQGLKLSLPEPIPVQFSAGVGETYDGAAITDPNPTVPNEFLEETKAKLKAVQGYEFTDADIELLFWTTTRLVDFVDDLHTRFEALESRIENHNVRGSHKI